MVYPENGITFLRNCHDIRVVGIFIIAVGQEMIPKLSSKSILKISTGDKGVI